MRRWPSRNPTNGVISLEYQLAGAPETGMWTIRVQAMSQIHEHQYFIEKYYLTFFEVLPSAPVYVLDSAESYKSSVTVNNHRQKLRLGNVTVGVYVNPRNASSPARSLSNFAHFKFVKKETIQYPTDCCYDEHLEQKDFEYEVYLDDVRRALGGSIPPGSLIRVQYDLTDQFLGETRRGYIETRVIRAHLKFQFAGTQPAVFKPGMPFHGHLYIMYDDNQPLEADKLAGASLRLRAIITTSNGGSRPLTEMLIPRKDQYRSRQDRPWWIWNDWQDGGAGGGSTSGGGGQQSRTRGKWTLTDRQKESSQQFVHWMEELAHEAEFGQFRAKGIHPFSLDIPKDARSMKVTAYYEDMDGDQVTTELPAISFYSASETYVHVSTSNDHGSVGQSVVFHLKCNQHFDSYQYVVTSKGMVLHNFRGVVGHLSKLVTFSVTVSAEMTPTFTLVAMVVSPSGHLVSDSITIPVVSINRYQMNITAVQIKDHSKDTVQLVTRSQPGSYVGVSILRYVNHHFQADNQLTPSRFLKALYQLEPFNRSIIGVTWSDREGLKAERSQYFIGQNAGPDTRQTFDQAGLIVFTDAYVTQSPNAALCNESVGYSACITSGCYHQRQRCDGRVDCVDGSDEDQCAVSNDDQMFFRLYRTSRFHDFFDWGDGDWAWYDIPITNEREEYHDRAVAQTDETWYINGFSFHPELGLSILPEPVEYVGSPPFYFTAEYPDRIRRGETVGIRLYGINNMEREMMAVVILKASDDYLFVETDANGEAKSYNPSLVKGEHHHMITVKAGHYYEVYVPVAPQIEQGTLTVNLQVISQIRSQDFEVEIKILPEGGTMKRHTSMLLDLKNRAHLLKYLEIPVEETPIIPYFDYRRYIFGSPRATVTLTGDVFGPVFPKAGAVSTAGYLGRILRGTESLLFSLGTTTWSLHYLRLTRQLKPKVLYKTLEQMNVHMAGLMRLYRREGSFRLHPKSKPSVWVTAWVVRILSQSQFQDWENHYFVDRNLLSNCVKWILSHQNNDGSFYDSTGLTPGPFDSNRWKNSSTSVEHTAHVLLALTKCSDSLHGHLKVAASNAKLLSVRLLENKIKSISDPYEVAIAAYALSVTNSPAKEAAFNRMHQLRRETDGMIYWSRKPVPVNGIILENNRPFTLPRAPNQQDSEAVEATSYALLVRLARDGVGDFEERIVTWLNTMRMFEGGFVSIFDTITAMEALTEYAYRARLRDITDMSIAIDASSTPNSTHVYKIEHDTLARVHRFKIPNVWGHVNILGQGAGQAVVQLDVQYGVDWEQMRDKPLMPYFDLHVDESYSYFRNKSHITVKACVRWLATNISIRSNHAILEVEKPSGYGMVQSDADKVVVKNDFLLDVKAADDRVIWMFDEVGNEKLCFDYEIHRWFPVANLTQFRSAIIYDSFTPEHFETHIFNSAPLYFLGICEVCGSYQCPYCPYFSAASVALVHPVVYFLTAFLLVFVNYVPTLAAPF